MDDLITRVFPGNNSAEGFFSWYESGLQEMERIYILKGGPGTGKSTLLRELALALTDRGLAVELWQCSSDNDSLDGVVIPALRCAVVDGTAPHIVEPRYPGAVEDIVNLGDCWDGGELRRRRQEIRALTAEISALFHEAYKRLALAGDCERERQAAAAADDPEQVEAAAEQMLDAVFGGERRSVRHLFGSAVTPEGVVDYRRELAARRARRIYLDGAERDCTELLQRLAEAAQRKRLAADVFHGHLLPETVTLVVLPDLDCAVLAGTEEAANGDTVIRLPRREAVAGSRLSARRDEELAAAVAQLDAAHRAHDRLEAHYKRAMDFDRVAALREKLLTAILHPD